MRRLNVGPPCQIWLGSNFFRTTVVASRKRSKVSSTTFSLQTITTRVGTRASRLLPVSYRRCDYSIATSHSSTNLEVCDAGGLTRLTASLLRGRGRGLSWEEGHRGRLWIHQEGASFHRFIRILQSRLLSLRLSAFFDTCRSALFAIFPSNRHDLPFIFALDTDRTEQQLNLPSDGAATISSSKWRTFILRTRVRHSSPSGRSSLEFSRQRKSKR